MHALVQLCQISGVRGAQRRVELHKQRWACDTSGAHAGVRGLHQNSGVRSTQRRVVLLE